MAAPNFPGAGKVLLEGLESGGRFFTSDIDKFGIDRDKISKERYQKGSGMYTITEMRNFLRQLGLKTSGSKSVVADRLLEAIDNAQPLVKSSRTL